MANSRGNPNFGKKTTETPNETGAVDINKLIQEALEKQKKELEKENSKKIKELEAQLAVKNTDNEILIVPNDAYIEIRQNIGGTLLLKENKGKIIVHIPLNKYRAVARISYEELNALYGAKPSLFTSGKAVITSVRCADKRITLQEVIKDLLLEDIYFNKDKVSPLNVEDIFTDKVSDREFERLVSNSTEIIETILEIAYILYRKGAFNNNSKMNYLRQLLARPNLFK
jgi:hypothetical protein